jgi:hypothetical protein
MLFASTNSRLASVDGSRCVRAFHRLWLWEEDGEWDPLCNAKESTRAAILQCLTAKIFRMLPAIACAGSPYLGAGLLQT